MLPFVPSSARRALDVGCGGGSFGSILRSRGVEVWGIEPNPTAAEKARERLDHVVQSDFAGALASNLKNFDVVCFNDVLEHMVDPCAALLRARAMLSPNGVVVASIPNFRYYPNLVEILWRADFEYKKSGILDATHMRFFTRRSIARMFDDCGYRVASLTGICALHSRRVTILERLSMGRLGDLRFQAFAVVAAPTQPKASA